MPIGAENIGTAYVRVLADGKDFDLGEMFEGVEGDADRSGRRLSQAYAKGFREEMDKAPDNKSIDGAIRKSLIKGDTARRFTASQEFYKFKNALVKEFGEIGKRAGQNLDDELSSGRLDISGFASRIENLNRELIRAEKELNSESLRERKSYYEEAYRLNAEFDRNTRQLQADGVLQERAIAMNRARTLQEAYDLNAKFDRARETQWRIHLDHIKALEINSLRDRQDAIRLDQAYRLNNLFDQRREIDMQRELAMVTRAYAMNEKFDLKQRALLNDNLSAKYRKLHTQIREVADATGAAFGRGSRNNFLNFVGSVARNIVGLGANMVDLAGHAVRLKKVFSDAGGGMAGFGAVAKQLRPIIAGVIGGITGLFVVIGPLLSILSGLGGTVLALASSMGGALLGAISSLSASLILGLGGGAAIAASAFVPLLAGIGIFALAIKNVDKDTKASLKSIGDGFTGLGKVASDAVFGNITEQARRFKAVIGDLSPLVEGIGDAISRVGDNWLDMMEGPGFVAFRNAMERFLPDAVENLGNSIGNVAAGFAGLFRAVIPQSRIFLGWVEKITSNFAEWSNSMAGQVTLKQFFSDAAEAARDLADFAGAAVGLVRELVQQANRQAPGGIIEAMTNGLKSWTEALDRNPDIMAGWIDSMESFGKFAGSVRDLLLEVLSAGKEVGDSLFASMSSTIDGFVRTLRANPDILRGWYDSAGAFARALGDVVIGLGKVFDALDNPFSRGLVTGVFEGLATAINLAAGALQTIASLFGDGGDNALGFAGQVAGAAVAVGVLSKAVGGSALVTGISTFITNMRTAETRMSALGGAARLAAGAGGLLAFQQGTKTSNEAAGILLQTLGGAATGFAFGGPWGALIGGAAGAAMAVFGDKTADAGKDAANASPQFAGLASTLDQITGAATQATRAQILQAAAQKGVIGQAAAFGISARDIVSASLGYADAQERVNAALQKGAGFTVSYKDEFGGLNSVQLDTKKQVREFTAELERQGLELDNVSKKAIDAAGAAAITDFLGDAGNEWAGLTKKVKENYLATQDLSGLLGKFPKKIATRIDAEGVAPTISGVAKVAAKYDLLPKQVRTLLQTMGVDLSVRDIIALQRKLDETDRKRPRPKIDVDKAAADSRLADLRQNLDIVGRIHKTPKVTVDAGAAISSIGNIKNLLDSIRDKNVTITETHRRINIGGPQNPSPTAVGGTFLNDQVRRIAEAGPEAVVPLARNLSQVDPSVRALSAIAQGKVSLTGPAKAAKTVDASGWTIVTPTSDPEAVAREVLDRFAGAGY